MSAAKELLELSLRRLENQTRELETEVESAQATYDTLLTQLQTLQNGITTNLDGHTHLASDFIESNTPAFIQLRVTNAFAEIRDNTVSFWTTLVSQQLAQTDLFVTPLSSGVAQLDTKVREWTVFFPIGAELFGYADYSTVQNVTNLTKMKAKLEIVHPTNEIVYETSGWQGYEFDGNVSGIEQTLDGIAWALRISWKNEEAISSFRIRLTHDYDFTPALGFGWIPGNINVFRV